MGWTDFFSTKKSQPTVQSPSASESAVPDLPPLDMPSMSSDFDVHDAPLGELPAIPSFDDMAPAPVAPAVEHVDAPVEAEHVSVQQEPEQVSVARPEGLFMSVAGYADLYAKFTLVRDDVTHMATYADRVCHIDEVMLHKYTHFRGQMLDVHKRLLQVNKKLFGE
jgi:hypothetical protein